MVDDGQSVIEKNLDVAHFIKVQEMTKTALKVLFNDTQRMLLRHNRNLVLPKRTPKRGNDDSTSSDSGKEFEKRSRLVEDYLNEGGGGRLGSG